MTSSPNSEIEAFERGRCCDHRLGHCHRLENFILDAARDLQRRNDRVGMGDIGTDIGHAAGDMHVATCEAAQA